jgi:uncharacterized protein (TIGR03083 family)
MLPPLQTAHLFSLLDEKLIELLESLTPEEWEAQTVARLWKVKDVAAHLLDGNIRALSIQRDDYFGEVPPAIDGYESLVGWLNELNADWVKASRRISPKVMVLLHKATGPLVSEYFASLEPYDKAVFGVEWAGEQESYNWMHVAREYTEKWLHQQQIRDAVNKPGIITPQFFKPFMQAFAFGLPHTYRDIPALPGTTVELAVTTEAGGKWYIERKERWELVGEPTKPPAATVTMDPDTAWKLFSKSLRPADAGDKVTIGGNGPLGQVALGMVSVMA